MLRFITLICLAIVSTGCVFALPPSRTDVSTFAATGRGSMEQGLRVTSGIHLASATRSRDTPMDIGAGVVYERRSDLHASSSQAIQSNLSTGSTSRDSLSLSRERWGGYLEVSKHLSRDPHTRAWLGARAEVLRGEDGGSPIGNLVGRLAWELHGDATGAGVDGSNQGLLLVAATGTIGVGMFVEGGLRLRSGEPTEAQFTAGLSLRLPAFFALCLCIK